MGKCHITRFAGPPTEAPLETGHHWVDTANNETYLSKGTGSVADWQMVLNPNNISQAQVGLGNVDNTSDADKPVSTAQQSALDTKYDASNPDGFQDAAQVSAAVQTLADTISAEQTTQNVATTAAAALGTAAQVSADAAQLSIDDHLGDLDNPHDTSFLGLTDIIPNAFPGGDRFFALKTNAAGTGIELFELFEADAVRTDPLLNQTTTFAQYLSLTVDVPVTGDYLFMLSQTTSINSITVNFESHILKDGGFFLINHVENKDSGGTGVTVPNTTGGTTNTGTDQMITTTGFKRFSLTAGTHTFTLEFRGQAANQEATIYAAEMYLKRVVR